MDTIPNFDYIYCKVTPPTIEAPVDVDKDDRTLAASKAENDVQCCICSSKIPPYKCASCTSRYCSSSCFKVHKEKCVSAPKVLPVPIAVGKTEIVSSFSPDALSAEQLKGLSECQLLRTLLQDSKLRSMLFNINQSHNPSAALRQAMKNDKFAEFAAVVKDVVEPDRDRPLELFGEDTAVPEVIDLLEEHLSHELGYS